MLSPCAPALTPGSLLPGRAPLRPSRALPLHFPLTPLLTHPFPAPLQLTKSTGPPGTLLWGATLGAT